MVELLQNSAYPIPYSIFIIVLATIFSLVALFALLSLVCIVYRGIKGVPEQKGTDRQEIIKAINARPSNEQPMQTGKVFPKKISIDIENMKIDIEYSDTDRERNAETTETTEATKTETEASTKEKTSEE